MFRRTSSTAQGRFGAPQETGRGIVVRFERQGCLKRVSTIRLPCGTNRGAGRGSRQTVNGRDFGQRGQERRPGA